MYLKWRWRRGGLDRDGLTTPGYEKIRTDSWHDGNSILENDGEGWPTKMWRWSLKVRKNWWRKVNTVKRMLSDVESELQRKRRRGRQGTGLKDICKQRFGKCDDADKTKQTKLMLLEEQSWIWHSWIVAPMKPWQNKYLITKRQQQLNYM